LNWNDRLLMGTVVIEDSIGLRTFTSSIKPTGWEAWAAITGGDCQEEQHPHHHSLFQSASAH
jgi:hypothetical protein